MDLTLILLTLAGFGLLLGGAELLVRGASALALRSGLSPLVVGLTVVAFGTSAPELAVSVGAGLNGQGAIALGNVVGSNILNVLLILGLSALVTPLLVDSRLVRRDVPLLIGASGVVLVMALDGRIGRLDGLLLLAGIVAYTASAIVAGRREGASAPAGTGTDGTGVAAPSPDDGDAPAKAEAPGATPHPLLAVGMALGGLALLVLGANWLVDGAVALARWLGISELVIGLTVVAVGTSLPELATSVVAALRGMRDMAVGNVIGSCLFNLLAVAGAAAAISPGGLAVSGSLTTFDLPVMIATAVACLPIFITGNVIARWEGALFLAYYVAYVGYVVLGSDTRAGGHPLLGVIDPVMLGFVLPLTAVTLALLWYRERRATGRGAVAGRARRGRAGSGS